MNAPANPHADVVYAPSVERIDRAVQEARAAREHLERVRAELVAEHEDPRSTAARRIDGVLLMVDAVWNGLLGLEESLHAARPTGAVYLDDCRAGDLPHRAARRSLPGEGL